MLRIPKKAVVKAKKNLGLVILSDSDSDCGRSASEHRPHSPSPELFSPDARAFSHNTERSPASPSLSAHSPSVALRPPEKSSAVVKSGAPPQAKRTQDDGPFNSTKFHPSKRSPITYPREGVPWSGEDVGLLMSAVEESKVGSLAGDRAKEGWSIIGMALGRKALSCLTQMVRQARDFTEVTKYEAQKAYLEPPPSATGRADKIKRKLAKTEEGAILPKKSKPLRFAGLDGGGIDKAGTTKKRPQPPESSDDEPLRVTKSRGGGVRWSREDDTKLVGLVERSKRADGRPDWNAVTLHFPGRSKASVTSHHNEIRRFGPANVAALGPAAPAPRPRSAMGPLFAARPKVEKYRPSSGPNSATLGRTSVGPLSRPARVTGFDGVEIVARKRLSEAEVGRSRHSLMVVREALEEEEKLYQEHLRSKGFDGSP